MLQNGQLSITYGRICDCRQHLFSCFIKVETSGDAICLTPSSHGGQAPPMSQVPQWGLMIVHLDQNVFLKQTYKVIPKSKLLHQLEMTDGPCSHYIWFCDHISLTLDTTVPSNIPNCRIFYSEQIIHWCTFWFKAPASKLFPLICYLGGHFENGGYRRSATPAELAPSKLLFYIFFRFQ